MVPKALVSALALKPPLYCSFCRRDEHSVHRLIGGPGVAICGACVERCQKALDGRATPGFAGWHAMTDEQLLMALAPSVAAVEASREVLQAQVAALRRRGMSWATIGAALGISRQAAWERFS